MEVRDEVRQLAAPLADEAGYELVDIEFAANGRDRVIRVLLDKPGGITVGDCGQFSRRLADCLDMNQTLSGNYRLEVSSPGMDRPLRSIEAVARFAGRRAAVTTYEARDGRRNFEGTLLEPDGHQVGLRLEQDQEYWFEWAGIKSIRLVVVDPWAGLRQSRAPGSPGGRRPEEKSR